MKTKLLTLILCLVLALTCGAAFAEQLDAPDESKTVASLEVYTMPTKTVYVIGDTFSPRAASSRSTTTTAPGRSST